MQLGDGRFEWEDEELLALTSNETKAIERLERIGNLKVNVNRKVFCEPSLDTAGNIGRRWGHLCLADEMICERCFLGLLVLGAGDQVVKNASIVVDIAEIEIFRELHVIL